MDAYVCQVDLDVKIYKKIINLLNVLVHVG